MLGCAIVLAALGNGCMKKYVEVRVRDGGAVGVGTGAGQGFVPVLAPNGSQGMATFPPSTVPVTVIRQGYQIAVMWPGAPSLELVNGAGAFPPLNPNEGIELRGGSLYAYYNLAPTKITPIGDRRGGSLPIVLSTPATNITEAVEIHEPRYWPAYVFLPTGGLFTIVGAGALTVRGDDIWQAIGWTYLATGLPLIAVGIVNAVQTSEAVPLDLLRGPGP